LQRGHWYSAVQYSTLCSELYEGCENCTKSLQNQAFSSKFGLPVNNTVKKEELTWKTWNCLLESMDSSTKPDTGIKRIVIEWAQRIYVVETDRTVPKKRNRDADR
jgi:hypothetical protein